MKLAPDTTFKTRTSNSWQRSRSLALQKISVESWTFFWLIHRKGCKASENNHEEYDVSGFYDMKHMANVQGEVLKP